MENQQTHVLRIRGIYLLPNLITTVGLFAGFYAIVAAMKGRFDTAALAIFIAMVADSLDGRVARLMKANTAFGVQYDSMADMVSFGLAPALVVYVWSLQLLGKIGWLAAFFYAASVALRLARFNIQVETTDKKYFKGMPSPTGAAILASFVWLFEGIFTRNQTLALVVAVITVLIAFLMVSNVRYYSFKEFDFKGKVPFVMIFFVVIIFVAIAIDPPKVLFFFFAIYGLSGPVLTLYRWREVKRFRQKRHQHTDSNTKDPNTQ